ncbi:hypothetical protein [Polaromonas sp. JS666]|uniref:hypothetical protein n=1 Tax=Polaromonas sp. (strain JS666 / ATCC BAA-500) TaxID=296591 RepID=UPI0000532004|nr:hypothetical protein [Polaromonas sp. JS666]ABE45629.1 hypothetical protein Bpro_3730 [Polaromonas sp. JS666]
MFYSKLTGGFYSADLHGSRTLVIADAAWVPPLIDGMPDPSAIAPTIEINNPDCKIPPDAVEITDEQHAALLEGQTQGKRIEADANGAPVLITPPAPTLDALKEAAQAAIDAHFEVLYSRTVPNGAIASEYDAAYMAAKAWLVDMTKPAPERVKALAEGYGLTDEQAAQVVVQKWTEANAVAFDHRGAARLRAKAAIRAAATALAVADAEAAGKLAMESVTFSI